MTCVAVSGQRASDHAAGVFTDWHSRFERHVESVDMKQVVQRPQVVTFQPVQREIYNQELSSCPEPLHAGNVLLCDFVYQPTAQLEQRICLVIVELGEFQTGRHEQLCEINDNGRVFSGSMLSSVDYPSAANRHAERSGEVGRLYRPLRFMDYAPALFLANTVRNEQYQHNAT